MIKQNELEVNNNMLLVSDYFILRTPVNRIGNYKNPYNIRIYITYTLSKYKIGRGDI